MVRWEPGATDRLRVAALDLYLQQGYEQTTVGEIAKSVGLTERTFFRHFADKREVLFDAEGHLEQAFVDAVAAAPPEAAPLEVIQAALTTTAQFFGAERRSWSQKRYQVISANLPLKERELLKMASLANALAAALQRRGVPELVAALAAQTGIAVFTVAFEQWIADGETRSLVEVERELLGELKVLAAALR
ncbi:TetR family transcriptional regulator [Kribbella antibiotica]|uniref:TetR family transcriptional regulator n=1 Tax=Kribbella antibiotica TaxID=190195 RepID=A0A4V2YQN3_9ACTN|nr:TetR/AcrR family transcriptional regulator [Kribbella antibiotica]TDD62737.1 TetR family transcriptional regulator [Kribbella antibiotica]